jgi:hypothetical protein
MNRRDFIVLREGAPDTAEVSCERLFIHFSNAISAGNADDFLRRTAEELGRARRLLLKDAFWLEERKMSAALGPVLDAFRARGGVIDRI